MMKAVPPRADRQGHQGRSKERGRCEQSYLPGSQPEREQIGWQKYGDVAIGEGPHGPALHQRKGRRVCADWQEYPMDHWLTDWAPD